MTLYHSSFSTVFGPFSVAVDSDGALVATAFGDTQSLRTRILSGDRVDEFTLDAKRVEPVCRQVLEYCAGQRQAFELPIAPHGTPFQQAVWRELRRIPCGETRSYLDIARVLGRTTASRAVGRANATNPICLIVPCHRVIGSDGSLTGFAFGETLKADLLAHERQHAAETTKGKVTAARAKRARLEVTA